MNKRERENLYKEAENCVRASTNRNDEIVLYEDGKETKNTYPIFCMYEPDTKSVNDWVRDIIVQHDVFEQSKTKLHFVLKKC